MEDPIMGAIRTVQITEAPTTGTLQLSSWVVHESTSPLINSLTVWQSNKVRKRKEREKKGKE